MYTAVQLPWLLQHSTFRSGIQGTTECEGSSSFLRGQYHGIENWDSMPNEAMLICLQTHVFKRSTCALGWTVRHSFCTGRLQPCTQLEKTFMESLICNIDSKSTILTCFEGDPPLQQSCAPSQGHPSQQCTGLTCECPFPGVEAFMLSCLTQVEEKLYHKRLKSKLVLFSASCQQSFIVARILYVKS